MKKKMREREWVSSLKRVQINREMRERNIEWKSYKQKGIIEDNRKKWKEWKGIKKKNQQEKKRE